jgi:hypothetical protein
VIPSPFQLDPILFRGTRKTVEKTAPSYFNKDDFTQTYDRLGMTHQVPDDLFLEYLGNFRA